MQKMSNKQPKQTPCDLNEIAQISYTIFSSEQIKNYSVVQINEQKFYENDHPKQGGVFDLRMGISNPDQKCQTCGESAQCFGHIGHIKLNQTVLHYGFLKHVLQVLKCICHHCMRLKRCKNSYDQSKIKQIRKIIDLQKRLTLLQKLLQPIKKCQSFSQNDDIFDRGYKSCGYTNPTRISIKDNKIIYDQPSKKNIPLPRKQIKKLLNGISLHQNQCQIMGFIKIKPIDLMIQYLIVPPPQVRPYVLIKSASKYQDQISVAYATVVRLNKLIISKNMMASQKQVLVDEMENLIGSIMFKLKRTNRKNKEKSLKIKSIMQRWRGKQGRFRQNLLGKRVDFSARSVISADPNLNLGQVGVPESIAKHLTYPQKINSLNYNRIIQLCLTKKVKTLISSPQLSLRNQQTLINVQKIQATTKKQMQSYISYNMIAQRILQNGDYVLLNRQPTLHRMSMMAHKVRILPYNTFRINLSVCMPYNADFDGDQMNIHVPQSYQSLSQLKNISAVQNQIVGPKNGTTTMGFSQDSLLGAYLITSRDTFLTIQDIMNLLMWIQGDDKQNIHISEKLPIPAILQPKPLWTGKQLISIILPKQLSLSIIQPNKQSFKTISDETIIIIKGELLLGNIKKQLVGTQTSQNNIIHYIWIKKGTKQAQKFINNLQKIIYYWLIGHGFTISVNDIIPNMQLINIKKLQYEQLNKLYYHIINQYRNKKQINDKYLHQQGKKIVQSFQYNINLQLNNKFNKIQQLIKNLSLIKSNHIFQIIQSKSKGSYINLIQILFSVGNQNINGKRLPLGFFKRSLPHFLKDDYSPSARGYVMSSFFQGLKPDQFFFHSMGGREGLSDTAVKTSHVGYIQRKIMKSLQNLIVKYDSSVRDSRNNIIQNIYGQDGFSTQFIQKHRCHSASIPKTKFRNIYKWKIDQLKHQYRYSLQNITSLKKQYNKLYKMRKIYKNIFCKNVQQPLYDYYCPISINKIINQISNNKNSDDKIQPLQIYQCIQNLIAQCVLPLQKYNIKKQPNKDQTKPQSQDSFSDQFQRQDLSPQNFLLTYYNHPTKLQQTKKFTIFQMHLRFNLASKPMIKIHNLSKQNFYLLIKQIKYKFFMSLASAGQSVGCLSSQSIGQPTTQMTLNTFHLAGMSDRNVTLGLPRLEQLLNCSKVTSIITIFPLKPILYSQKMQQQNQNYLFDLLTYHFPQRKIKDFLCSVHYSYHPQSLLNQQYNISSQIINKKKTPLMIQFIFNSHQINAKQIWLYICQKIRRILPQNLEIYQIQDFIDISSKHHPIIKLRYLQLDKLISSKNVKYFKQFDKKSNINKILSSFQNYILQTVICGIPNLKSVKISKRMVYFTQQLKQKQYIVFQATGPLKSCLSHPKINNLKTYSNNIQQTLVVLGIQAARQTLVNQFKQVLKPYGILINYKHLSVLVDWMCTRGVLTSINRHGLHKIKTISTLTKVSYEQSIDILFKAALFSQKDSLKDTSQRIIFGQQVQCGTNNCKLMIDPQKVTKYTQKLQEKPTKTIPYLQQQLNQKTPNHQSSKTNDNSMFDAWRNQLNSSFQPLSSRYISTSPNHIAPLLSFSPTYSPNITNIGDSSPKYPTDHFKHQLNYSHRSINSTFRTVNSPSYNMNSSLNGITKGQNTLKNREYCYGNDDQDEVHKTSELYKNYDQF